MSVSGGRRGTIDSLRKMSFAQKSDIEICLQGSEGVLGCTVQSFSTLDRIDGVAIIAPRVDTSFELIEIAMIGRTFIPFDSNPNLSHPIVSLARAWIHLSVLSMNESLVSGGVLTDL